MKSIMAAARSPHESSFSFSRRHFQKIIEKVMSKEHGEEEEGEQQLTSDANANNSTCRHHHEKKKATATATDDHHHVPHSNSISKLIRSALCTSAAIVGRTPRRPSRRVVCGTMFGYRRGHVHVAFQRDPKSAPTLLIELHAMPMATLVREMASGLVRIALECDRRPPSAAAAAAAAAPAIKKKKKKMSLQQLDEEELEVLEWRAYCNGKKCGFARASRRECGADEARLLKAVEAVTMGAGVLPGGGPRPHGGRQEYDLGDDGMMYMRARFERVVGYSRDSEAFYMINPPDNIGINSYSAPELSLYLLRSV